MAIALVTMLLGYIPPVGRLMAGYLALRPAEALWPRPYQLLIGPLLVTSPFSLLFLGLLFYSVGGTIEEHLGTRRFLWLNLIASVAAGVAAALAGLLQPETAMSPVLLNAGPVFMVAFLAFARLYGHMPVRMFGIGAEFSARSVSYFFIGISLLNELFGTGLLDALKGSGVWRPSLSLLAASLASLGVTHLAMRGGGGGISRSLRDLFKSKNKTKAKRARGQIEVLDGGLRGPLGGTKRWVN